MEKKYHGSSAPFAHLTKPDNQDRIDFILLAVTATETRTVMMFCSMRNVNMSEGRKKSANASKPLPHHLRSAIAISGYIITVRVSVADTAS